MKFTILCLLLFIVPAAAQDSGGKISGYMFGDYFYNIAADTGISSVPNAVLNGPKDLNGFQFRRIYFTYDYKISDKFTTRFRLEADQQSNTVNNKIGVFVKDAYLQWNIFKNTDLIFGIQPTPAFEVSESFWRYRSLEKTILDLRGYVSSRDFALSLKGALNSTGTINYWVMAGNNSGNVPESNKYKRLYAHLHFIPIPGFEITTYGDIAFRPQIPNAASTINPQGSVSNNYITAAVFAGYSKKNLFSAGAEFVYRSSRNELLRVNGANIDLTHRNGAGLSMFGSVEFSETAGAVVRYDFFDPVINSGMNNDSRHFIITGLELKPDPKVSIMPNFMFEIYENSVNRDISPSVVGRVTLFYRFL